MFSQMNVKQFKFTAYAEEEFSPFHTQSSLVNYRQVTIKRSCENRTFSKIPVNLFWQSYRSYGDDMITLAVYKAPLLFNLHVFLCKYVLDGHLWPSRLAAFLTCRASPFIRAATLQLDTIMRISCLSKNSDWLVMLVWLRVKAMLLSYHW